MYSIGKFSKLVGVTTQTLRTWHSTRELVPCKVTAGGTRYYSETQLQQYISGNITTKKDIAIYGRVSNRSQKDDLNNQLDFLKQYCNAKGYITAEYTDIASGLNFKRKQWNILLEKVLNNEIEKIVISHKDRFVRFGFDWFEQLCNKFNCQIEVVNNVKLSPQEEMVQDLISIIHVFSCKIYGLRKYKKVLANDKSL